MVGGMIGVMMKERFVIRSVRPCGGNISYGQVSSLIDLGI